MGGNKKVCTLLGMGATKFVYFNLCAESSQSKKTYSIIERLGRSGVGREEMYCVD